MAAQMSKGFSVTVDGGDLVIRLPLESPRTSASGKTMVVASTRGNVRTGVQVGGKDVTVGVNAYVRA